MPHVSDAAGGCDVEFRDMAPGEEQAVLDLVMRGFDELVRPDFSDEGASEFTRAATSFVIDRPAGHHITVAESTGELVGMVDVRDRSHVCLFFVDADYRGRGVGRELLAAALGADSSSVTVNSSPWAVPVYERLGFVSTGPEIERNGIRAVPMVGRT
jgi:GNAT superfamily N-acetyltransferase